MRRGAGDPWAAVAQAGSLQLVNENDTVAVEELKFGDNDTLSALVAGLVGAEWLFLLTDVDRLYSDDPRHNPEAQPIEWVQDMAELADLQVQTGKAGSNWGTGGMVTKLQAARIATEAGVRMVITEGRTPQNIQRILAGENLGTHFAPRPETLSARKRWIAHGSLASGKLYLDPGAVQALCRGGKSLLAAGLVALEGEFEEHDTVVLCDAQGQELGRGLTSYSSPDLARILGRKTEEICKILNLEGPDEVLEVVHRDNLVITTVL